MQRDSGLLTFFFLIGIASVIGLMAIVLLLAADASPNVLAQQLTAAPSGQSGQAAQVATETIPPYTPLATLTPSQTLLPPPTFEPPTATPIPSSTATFTATPVYEVNVSIPGLHGGETATPTTTPGCEVREDWHLTYTVQFDDALERIANRYGLYTSELAAGNCIEDPDVLREGQVLHVPGDAQPEEPAYVCTDWEVLTPFNGQYLVPADGSVTFNWRGPVAPKYLIRVTRPDGTQYEQLVELRMNDTIDVSEHLRQEGTYTWYVYPLGEDFLQIPCLEGGPWTFYKPAAATYTPTMTPMPTTDASAGGGTTR
ncbi:MAG: LysM peptidoglycan-binding domain-containing protein [Anaerolineae bacterium]|nr:LysM peptidoglycan-binding domain-containing protein [Anaerolineae bacterium]